MVLFLAQQLMESYHISVFAHLIQIVQTLTTANQFSEEMWNKTRNLLAVLYVLQVLLSSADGKLQNVGFDQEEKNNGLLFVLLAHTHTHTTHW